MSTETLLARLEMVRNAGAQRWTARCPAHPDKRPSLSVRECSDGRILLHCWAGCETEAVLGVIGLTFRDVMPERLGDFPRERPPFIAQDALRCLAHEAGVVAIASAGDRPLTEADKQRLCIAAGRIAAALEFCYGH
jgi:hypothetical protein